ncbi:M23 family metallopeptidase [Hirschia baltica]|uniref:Peptidase M23 n=1 Tax=Hirschia baltica (strain ATCC 49814 / DSM 5838 / IFAM 1418) TaxID=582402 RepID=C6XK04_HIRBI|nr:M23 family metallopeptidase [Hirschia baltica]ACT59449.1 Peptidase M23 [Hirschia baltica ATCC 49814]
MADEVKAQARALFDRVFPERQIYHRSGGSVRYVSVSPFQQALFAGGATLVAGWCVFASVNTLLQGPTNTFQTNADERKIAKIERWLQASQAREAAALSLLEEKTIAFTNATSEFERRHATLKTLLGALKGHESNEGELALNGTDGKILLNSTIEEADARTSRPSKGITASLEVAGFRAQIDSLRAEQAAFLDDAEDRAVERAERMRGVLRLTGVGVGRVVDQSNTFAGGPLHEVEPTNFSSVDLQSEGEDFSLRVREVKTRLAEAQFFEDLILAMPLGAPVGVSFRETSGYGKRRDPFTGRLAWHSGLDMGAFRNAPVTATAPGKVVFAGRKAGYGRAVEVDHGFGFMTRYGHLASINVKKGDSVILGQKVGGMGTTGRSTGVHLHYEVHFRGKTYDPIKFLRAGKHVHQG